MVRLKGALCATKVLYSSRYVLYLCPNQGAAWSGDGVFGANIMNLRIPVMIGIALRLYEPRLCFDYLTITNHTDALLTDGAPLRYGGLKVYRDKTLLIHGL